MKRARKLLIPSIVAGALLAALALAATASAEILVGEATAPVNPAVKPEADITAAKVEYDSSTGSQTFAVTTLLPPSPGTVAEPNGMMMVAGLASPAVCNGAALGTSAYPSFNVQYSYVQPNVAIWSILESAGSEPKFPETAGQAELSTSAATTTFVATAPKAANRPFSCALAGVLNNLTPEGEFLVFPIAAPPPPTPPTATTPTPTQTQTPTPTPSHPARVALSIAKPKPLKLKAGKWKTVRIKIANTGGTTTASGSLRLKAPRGVLVRPKKQKLPMLEAGASWTIAAKVQLTAKAKKKSTVTVTAAAGGVTAKGSFVLKR